MAVIERSIEVEVPVRTAYNQWTQFEVFPQFMEGVENIQQKDDTHLHWKTELVGQTREFEAEITEQTPDQRIAWKAEGDVQQGGVVTFHRLDESRTRVMLQMAYEPEGVVDKAGQVLGVVERRTQKDLENFKEFIESRGTETGGWRGEVKQSGTE
jgi:uncharacterized membrane protein